MTRHTPSTSFPHRRRRILALLASLALLGVLLPTAGSGPALAADDASTQRRVVGYFVAWGVYGRDYHVSDIPAEHLTHINYAFANISDGECVLGDPYADVDKFYPGDSWDAGALRGSFNQLIKLKERHPHLRTLISVGGWTWSRDFSDVASTPASRAAFAASCVEFMDRYGFDGIDIDWEYPVSGGLPGNTYRPEDKHNYTLLTQELRRRLDAKETADGRDYLLTIAAPAGYEKAANLEIAALAETLDFINIMSYDFHGGWESVTNHNAPLYPSPGDPSTPLQRERFNVDWAARHYLDMGTPRDKLVLGVPFYGRGWGGVSGGDGLFRIASSSIPGSWENGVFDYKDLAANYVGRSGWTRYWDAASMVPYLYNPNAGFISYDDTESIGHKADYVIEEDLGGVMAWELDADNGDLLDTISARFGGTAPPPTTTPPTTTPPTTSPPTTSPPPDGSAEFDASVSITSDWTTGYCADVEITNVGTTPGMWEVDLEVDGDVSSLWSATWSQTGSTVVLAGLPWNAILAADASTRIGFCAQRSSPPTTSPPTTTPPTTAPPPPPPPPPPPGLETDLTVTSDWGSGYCADGSVANTGSESVEWEISFEVDGNVSTLWNGTWTQSGSELSVRGAAWNAHVAAGASARFGFCAAR